MRSIQFLPFVILFLSGRGNALPTFGKDPNNNTPAIPDTDIIIPSSIPQTTNPDNTTTTPPTFNILASKKLIPNGLKAGIAGGQSYKFMQPYIGWWYDWTPNPSKPGKPIAIPMLWGLGRSSDPVDRVRFSKFKALPKTSHPYIMAYNEPDIHGLGSSGPIPIDIAAAGWNQYIAPYGARGSLLVSPSMASQKYEKWLAPFQAKIKRNWDITAVHIFQSKIAGVRADLEYFAKYGKPMMITEFACINYQVSPPYYCTQAETSAFMKQVVDIFQADSRVIAYSVSDAANGPHGSLTDYHGHLTATGQAYLNAIKPYAHA